MKKLSSIKLIVAAAVIGSVAGSAWSEEATPDVPAAPAGQTAAPGTGYVPGWYPPRPNQGGYAQPWQQPSQWPAPAPGYRQSRPYYPPYGHYRGVPAAPTENPLSFKLKQTQEQLAAKSTELNTANEQLSTSQAELQTTREALQQAQSGATVASQQLSNVMEQVDTLKNLLADLKVLLETQNTMMQSAIQAAASSDTEQAQSPTITQQESAVSAQTEVRENETTNREAQ